MPILEIWKQRFREIKKLIQGHIANETEAGVQIQMSASKLFPLPLPLAHAMCFQLQTTTAKDLNLLPNWRFLHKAGFGAIYFF